MGARVAAEAVGPNAGLALANPEALDDAPVTFDFQGMPAEAALQLIAGIDGRRAIFSGRNVHFEPK